MLIRVLESFETGNDVSDIDGSIDPVTHLVTVILKLCEMTKTPIKLNIVKHHLPKLCGSLTWFLRRWSLCYLKNNYLDDRAMNLVNDRYENLSVAATNKSLFFILEIIQSYLVAFKDDSTIVEEITRLLIDLVDCTNM